MMRLKLDFDDLQKRTVLNKTITYAFYCIVFKQNRGNRKLVHSIVGFN